ncbi:hypothetical protein GUJ93_ZPchr0009g2379 [Zizania palustris]|uniref:Nuclear pore complex protein NUP58 n=1 Tax=Zizania palustris TaxID=103762 RepID=A0A8J5RMM4_ZIZPA|nr:hypothetical protein GUJ93_ZPchr0009g2379 [Zizania palustris]
MAFSFSTPPLQNPFQTPAPAPAQAPSPSPSPFQFNFQQQQQQPQQQMTSAAQPQQQQQQQLMLYTTDGKPAGYNAKWEELHSESQKALLQIEDKIRGYRDESERLDQCARLHDSSISNVNFELDATHIAQELGGTTTMMEREKASVQELMTVVNEMMRNTEFAIRSYMMLRPRYIRPGAGANGGGTNPSGLAGALSNHPVALAPTIDFYSGIPKRPSLYMQQTINRFEKYLGECCKWIAELEQLVRMENNKRQSASLESLPKVMANVHDYFIYVASKMENLHQYVESLKTEYLHEHRRMAHNSKCWDSNEPNTAIINSFWSDFFKCLFSFQHSSFCSILFESLFYSNNSNFSSNIFGTSGSAQLSTPFGTVSTPTLGSTPAPSGFGSTTPSFASTPALGGTSLFSTPFGGVATASGSSFGGTSKGRSKPRGRR